jgi:WD40 repeat protein
MRRDSLLCIVSLLIVLAYLTQQYTATLVTSAEVNRVYAYTEDLSALGIHVSFVKVLDSSRVLVVGALGIGSGVVVLNIESPVPIVEDFYPLTGEPVYITTDGYPARRLAIGTTSGEVVVLSLEGGRITKYISTILGSDFNIVKLYLAKSARGYIVVALLEDPQGLRHVYVLDEAVTGILKISQIPGNATPTCPLPENSSLIDVGVMGVYGGSAYYWDASSVAVASLRNETVVLSLLDLSNAPNSCTVKSTVDTPFNKSIMDLTILRGEGETGFKIIFADPENGYVGIAAVSTTVPLSISSIVYDYVGIGARIGDAGTYTDGRYIIVGLSDGRIRVYTLRGLNYNLKHIYQLASNLLNLITVPGMRNYTYIAITASGVQAIGIEPYPTPVFRDLGSLYLTTPNYIHGDALGDLKLIVLGESQGLVVVKNANLAVSNGQKIILDSIITRSIGIRLSAPTPRDYMGGKLVVSSIMGSYSLDITSESIQLDNILPGVEYSVVFQSPAQHVMNGSFKFIVSDRDSSITVLEYENLIVGVEADNIFVAVKYIEYPVDIILVDPYGFTGVFELYLDGVKILDNVNTSKVSIRIPHGAHSIRITPAPGYENIYESKELNTTITNSTNIKINLQRKTYRLRMLVTEYGTPVSNVKVELYNWGTGTLEYVATTFEDGSIETRLPYGVYKVVVSHPQYNRVESVVALDRDVNTLVEITPTIQTLITRFSPIIGLAIAIIVVIVVIMRIRKTIMKRLVTEETF